MSHVSCWLVTWRAAWDAGVAAMQFVRRASSLQPCRRPLVSFVYLWWVVLYMYGGLDGAVVVVAGAHWEQGGCGALFYEG
jgi:hypothetical protein